MNGKFLFRIVAALVLIAAIAGIAFFAFNAGVAQGSPITIEAPAGQSVPAPYPYYGYGMPFHRPFGMGFGGCFGILITVFFLMLAMRAFRFMVWGPRWGWGHAPHMHGHGPWRRDWGERGVPPMVEEWHKRMHNVPTGSGEAPAEEKKG